MAFIRHDTWHNGHTATTSSLHMLFSESLASASSAQTFLEQPARALLPFHVPEENVNSRLAQNMNHSTEQGWPK
jgi:hypothetical protein